MINNTVQRFIPVLTGNRGNIEYFYEITTVYPRAYGEQCYALYRFIAQCGLSPCLRGTGVCKRAAWEDTRFIPVLTGNRSPILMPGRLLAVYPRAYGEQVSVSLIRWQHGGLSPCLRGTANPPTVSIVKLRFIPVLTGNRLALMLIVLMVAVYPRAYGEQSIKSSLGAANGGLSPCLRGTANFWIILYQ